MRAISSDTSAEVFRSGRHEGTSMVKTSPFPVTLQPIKFSASFACLIEYL